MVYFILTYSISNFTQTLSEEFKLHKHLSLVVSILYLKNYPQNERAIKSCETSHKSFFQVLLNRSSITNAHHTSIRWNPLKEANATAENQKRKLFTLKCGFEALKKFRELALSEINKPFKPGIAMGETKFLKIKKKTF